MARVLIVDDSPDQLNMFERAVKGLPEQNDCIKATSAEQAIKLITTQKPDLVLTDLRMEEDSSGIAVVKAANEAGKQSGVPIPVIVVTRFGDETTTEQGMAAGAFDWIDRNSSYYDSESMLKHKIEWALRYASAAAARNPAEPARLNRG